jgi:phosphatidylglycerophosphatase A
MWITLSLTNTLPLFWQVLLGFIFFRFFDIWKPSIIGRIERKANGGISVMLDDVIAGFFAAIAVNAIWIILVKWL